ncbi:MAG: FtsX-like permease family protein [Gammaproteobacteria bacterium]|nr:FtsX-like permease family protein [Gammaproteobacteria bacterium]
MLSLRLLARDWAAGELRLLTTALALAVAIVVGISAFTEQLKSALVSESNRFIAADRVLMAPNPAPEDWLQGAEAYGLRRGETARFASMLVAGDRMQLTGVKAVSPSYPLRGRLEISDTAGGPSRTVDHGPATGEIWLEARMLPLLSVNVGDRVEIGESRLRVGAILVKEPDRGDAFFSIAPHALMALADLPATRIIQPGSRVRYNYLFAGPEKGLAAYHDWLKKRLTPDYRWLNLRDTQPRVASALDRADRFLLLASTLGVALAGIAIAISARRYSERHYDAMAVMKCLGGREGRLFGLYLQQLLFIGLLGFALGAALGWAVQWGLSILLESYVGDRLPVPGWRPLAMGGLTAAVCLAAFALPPLLALRTIPPLRVFRRDLGNERRRAWPAIAVGLVSLTLLMWYHSRNLQLTLSLVLGACVTLAAGGFLVLQLLRWTRRRTANAGGALRLAMASLQRHPLRNALQVVMFALAIMLLLILIFVRTSLLKDWQRQLPPGTPNHFLVNILPEQIADVRAWLGEQRIAETDFYPMVRGRLTEINGTSIEERMKREQRHNEVQDRALNLTWSGDLPADNSIRDGSWWKAGTQTSPPEVSVETHLAGELDIRLGDRLTFQIGPETLESRVTSLRKVDWDNMRPNFYMIFPPTVLDEYAHTFITSLYLPPERKTVLNAFVQRFPTITVVEMDAIIAQVRGVVRQVTQAIELVLWLIIGCALLVLLAGVQASIDVRIGENALLRALGAQRRLITGSLWLEFSTIGLAAGVIAAFAAELAVWYFQERVMEMSYAPHPWTWLLGPLLGAVLVGGTGYLSCRHIVRVPPMRLLQAT